MRAENIALDPEGLAFDLVDRRRALCGAVVAARPFNVDNLLAVAGMLHALGDAPVDHRHVAGATAAGPAA